MDENFNDAKRMRWEARLVSLAARGDAGAFGELYRLYAPLLFSRVLMPKLGNRDAAEDALAETFRTAWEKLDRFEARGVSIYFWLSTIAKNKALDMHRAKGVTGRALASFESLTGPLVEPTPDPAGALSERDEMVGMKSKVDRALDRINPRYAQAIRLRFLEDRSRQSCAEELDVKVATFDVLLLRALRAFRKEWSRTDEEVVT